MLHEIAPVLPGLAAVITSVATLIRAVRPKD